MLNLLSITTSTRLRFLNKVTSLSCRCYSLASSSGNDSAIPRNYESSSFDLLSRSPGGATKVRGDTGSSLKDLLLDLSDVVPNITRRFRRVPGLKPENVLELLLGFQSEVQKDGIGSGKVRALWEIFRWANGQYKGFKHLPQAYEVMASMLIKEGMVKEVELLLMEMESQGDTLVKEGVFCDLIGKYVDDFDTRKAVMLFDWMRRKGLVPVASCYQTLINYLVRLHRTESAYRICLDWVETTAESDQMNIDRIGRVIELLCLDQRVQEARVLARKLVALGCDLNSSIYSKITLGYSEKQDFEDLLSFIGEVKYEPDLFVGNRIVHSLCKTFGSERAYLYMEELVRLGFHPDEVTFGILIGWCCYEGDIKRGFLYLSEVTSKGLKPDVRSYNAILGGLFRIGLWQHTSSILDEMKENGLLPSLSTYKIMVTGYCKARRFEEAKTIVNEMFGYGLIEASKVEDPLSEAFSLVGFDPLAVRLKRDNDSKLSKADFFDDLGNGLYLHTDLDSYEQKVNMVLDRSALPEFSSRIVSACKDGDLKTALGLHDEMARWGQKLSRRSFAVLMKSLCASRFHVKVSVSLLERWPKLANQLDGETLNVLVQEYCKTGFSRHSKLIFHRMVQMHHPIDNETYTYLISCFCKKETLNDLLSVWGAAQNANWLPDLNSSGALWEGLIRKGLVEEAVKLFERIFISYPLSQSETCKIFVEKLTVLGFASTAHSVVKRLEGKGYLLEQVVHNHLIKGLCKEKNDSTVFAILDELLDKKHFPSVESSLMLIPRLCGANKVEKAFTLAEKSDSSSVQYALIEGLCLAGMMSNAETQLRIMLSNGSLPNNDIYNLMFQGYCKGNNWKRAEEVLGILVRKNIICSVMSYREYVRKMCLERQFLSAFRLKEFLLVQGQSNPGGVIIYNLLIFYLFRANNHLEVNKVLLEIQGRGLLPDETTFNFLVHGYSLSGDYSSSVKYLSAMISEGMKPNNRSIRAVMRSLCDYGNVKKALDLWQVMESKGWILSSSVVQTKIAESLISEGEIPQAEDFLIRVTRNGMMARNYDNLIKKLSDHGNLDIAVHLLNTMIKNRSVPDSSSYDSVISGLLRCNQLGKAMDFQTEMVELGLSPSISTWGGLVHKYIEACQVLESEKLIKSMVVLGETPSQEMFKLVIDRFRVENNTVKASEMMEMMQKCGYEIDFETHWSLISNMSTSKEKKTTAGEGFLSRLLSGNGFTWKR
ncbi:PREDICTED: pentatricopeptide repeat-containing protein At5g15280-like [Camelina sativa]|uniref:Pentatricopeptide repeat-containing protein At5g15280-like n=1 Tax=Camelina sativa TaxID=90675 RepID=A0ABM0VBA9_CAMSA|nr:PREDICTED: pentatricopeptide repeat-containing protein At5g15280-like [Camelina sativa]